MRLIGHLENRVLAERAGVLLGANGIANRVEPDDARHWAVWVIGEEDLDRARQLLAAFLASPDDPRFRSLLPPSLGLPKNDEPRARRSTPSPQPSRESTDTLAGGLGIATIGLVLLCVWMAAVTKMGEDSSALGPLLISAVPRPGWARWMLMLPEVQRGEVWRLITPVLLHFSWTHLLFNLWTFWGLGLAIERQRGLPALVGMVIGFGILSNIGQYLQGGPQFGGMSGVIYGLLGYVWMLGKYRPSAGLALQPQIVLLMLVWLAIGVYGTLDVPVANTAHGVGLLVGVAWGRWAAMRPV